MSKPVIGVIPLIDYQKESLWMVPGYMEGIIEAGGLAVMLPLISDEEDLRQLVTQYDGFLFTGGQDVTPLLYNTRKLETCGECSSERDLMETIIFEEALKQDKPLLGICRGIQLINVLLGGTLYQDLPTQHESEIEHHMSEPYDRYIHDVNLIDHTPIKELLKVDQLPVNSYHHQAIREVSERLTVMAKANDGIVEGVYMKGRKFVWAIQWHPEFLYKIDEPSRKIFKAFVDASQRI